MAVRDACKPRKEVLKGDLDDAIFAADFGNLIADKAPAVYGDAPTFFENTHPAKSLCKVVQAVFARLAATKEGGATIRLSTGFGGGKTHTLMALWHLANNIADVSLGTDLLPAAGRPKQVKVVAVDAGKAGVPEFISHGKTKVHSLWGEIFYQLGGDAALKALGKADDPEASPNEGQVEKAFPKGPVLILLDELVIYMAKLSERGQGNLMGFLNSLASVVSPRRSLSSPIRPARSPTPPSPLRWPGNFRPPRRPGNFRRPRRASMTSSTARSATSTPSAKNQPASSRAACSSILIRRAPRPRRPHTIASTSVCSRRSPASFRLTPPAPTTPGESSSATRSIPGCSTPPRTALAPWATSRRAAASCASSPASSATCGTPSTHSN
jgi:hypothetical protein